MFKAGELEAISMALEPQFRELEQRIMSDIVRRISINGEITRAELRNSIQGLIEQYGIEDEHIISLITRYDNLTEAIQRLKAEAADEMLASAKSEAQDVEDLLIEQAKDNGQIYGKGDNKKFATTISAEGLNKESLQIIKDMGGVLDA